MRTSTIALLLGMAAALPLHGQTLNWAEHAAPIFYNNCVKCHNPNGVAPFELLSAQSAVDHQESIEYMVSTRQMPPWTPNPHYRRFASERILTQGEIDTIVNWIKGGTVIGDVNKAPTPPKITGTSGIEFPDLKLKAPDYTVSTLNGDHYRCFVVPYSIATDRYITDIDVLPGSRKSVHHVLLFHDDTTIPDSLDALDTAPGYPCFGGTGSDHSELIGGWVPGQQAQHLPSGIGLKLPAQSKAIIQVHYPRGTDHAIDSTKVLMKFSPNPLRNAYINPLLNHVPPSLLDGPLYIPAQTVKTFHAVFQVPFDASVIQIAPHMHLVGKSIKVWGVTPANDTIPFIHIPDWNFHWQGFYNFRNLLKVPAGTTLYSETVYDNTHDNHHNPDHGTKDVWLGEATSDEMMLVYFTFLPYQKGDEQIPIISTPEKPLALVDNWASEFVATAQLYDLAPNPTSDHISISFYLPQATVAKIEAFDSQGQRVNIAPKETFYFAGHHRTELDVSQLPKGQYGIGITINGKLKSKWFVKQ